jgi:hypothetical protein
MIQHLNKALESLGFKSREDYTLEQDDLSQDPVIVWTSSQPQPSESELQTASDEWQAEYDAQDYARKRAMEYPSIGELVVALYDTEDKSAIDEKRAAIKAKYPKP